LQTSLLMPIGGAETKTGQRVILSRFIELCGSSPARIVVIPAASGYAAEMGHLYCRMFSELGARNAECLHISDRRQANDPMTAGLLKDADGVFLTGGDQLKLMSLIGGTELSYALHESHNRGVPIAGTSAGASAMSRQMIAFGRSGSRPSQRMVQLASGLGLTSFIIDQHFTQRDRLGRLLTAVALNPGMIGIGIDEDTALVIPSSGQCEVIGSGTVTIVDGRKLEYTDIHAAKRYDPITVKGVDVNVLSVGEQYRFISRMQPSV
jgi:cyanophycinase